MINRTLRFLRRGLTLFETRSTAAICKDVVAAAGLMKPCPLVELNHFTVPLGI